MGLLASYLAGRLSDMKSRKPLIAVGSSLSSVGVFLLPLTGDVAQAAGVLSIRSLGFNIHMPVMRALRARTKKREEKKLVRASGDSYSGDIIGKRV